MAWTTIGLASDFEVSVGFNMLFKSQINNASIKLVKNLAWENKIVET
jgi:hypothetical protein